MSGPTRGRTPRHVPWGLPDDVRPGGRFEDWRPTSPRYIVADVDGTLLGDSPTASETVVAALVRARDAGLHVGFATGRMVASVEPLWQRTRLGGPHILHNGAQVRRDGKAIAAWPLGPGQVRLLLDVCRRHDLYAELYVGDTYFVTDRRPEAAIHWELLNHDPAGSAFDVDPDADEVVKATVAVFGGDDPAPVVGVLRDADLAAGVATSPLARGVSFINVTDPSVDKGRALAVAAQHLDVPLEAVLAVGDGLNDLSMLAVAGTAIAMGQAPAEVRDAAHLVVPPVDLDGVVHALDACIGWADLA